MEAGMTEALDRADIKATPPVIFSGFLIVGLLFSWGSSLHILPGVLARGLALCLLIAAGLIASTAILAMNRKNTAIHPRHPTTAIVEEGPYRKTRNPLYLSLVMIYLGLALLFNSFWMVLFTIGLAITLHRGVVLAEEAYLEGKFGDSYRDYKGRVPRWL
jgi:protein-S-isoprenylcysteine O-methyltransferase Ste14